MFPGYQLPTGFIKISYGVKPENVQQETYEHTESWFL